MHLDEGVGLSAPGGNGAVGDPGSFQMEHGWCSVVGMETLPAVDD